MTDATNKLSKKEGKSLPVISFFVVVMMLLFFMLISCTYTPNWKFTFDESENEDQSQEMALGQVTLGWDSNMEVDLEGYKLYYGFESGNYSYTIDVGYQTIYTITNLQIGETYYFSVTAYNNIGYESSYSNEVLYTIPSGG